LSDIPAPSTTSPTASAIWVPTLVAAVAGTVINALLYLVGKAVDVPFTAPDASGAQVEIVLANVVVPSLVGMLIGAVAAVIALPRWPSARRVLEVIGVGLALLSGIAPWLVEMDTGTKVLLTLMHVVLAVAYVAGIEAATRET
jgi:hypothetical protein